MYDFEARDSEGKKVAFNALKRLIGVGEKHQAEVIKHALKRIIVDRLVDPRVSVIDVQNNNLYINYREVAATISNHALSQMCGVAGVPKLYINKLMTECAGMSASTRQGLVVHVLNTHFREGIYLDRRKQRMKFLHRTLNGELWGFLSRSFNRKLGTVAMMRPFIEECAKQQAKPMEAHSSALKTSIKCVLPVIFEPIDGEFVAFGATYTNSDFGAGSLEISGTLLRVSSGSVNVLTNKLKRVHLGAIITDSEIELSDETLEKESAAHMSAVRDKVRDVFSQESIKNAIDLVAFAHQHKISWDNLKNKANEVLSKAELAELEKLLHKSGEGIIDLPPVTTNKNGDAEANAWWAAAALGQIAASTEEVDRKLAIQGLAGELLEQ
jgi:hypothetical protein